MAHNLSSWPLLECICLPPREAQSRVTRSILEPVILQVFGLLIYSVKIFFACGGHEGVRSQCPVAMAPVAHARARVVVDHRQVRLMIGGSACCTSVLTLRWRAAHLNTSTWAIGNATRQSALWRRVGCGTRHRSPRGVLCVWSSTSSSSCGFWLFPGTWVGLAAARPSTIFQGFCVLCASKPEKFSGLAGADGHRTES